VLRQTDTVRLVFIPIVVDNREEPDACVKGTFVYQRKSRESQWERIEKINLSSLKSGEGVQLEIKSAELLHLIRELAGLRDIHGREGIPRGTSQYIKVSDKLAGLSNISDEDWQGYLAAHKEHGSEILGRFLRWVTETGDLSELLNRLQMLGSANLQRLNAAVGLERLKSVLGIWNDNRGNNDEEFWQKTLAENSFLFEHVFAWPTTILRGKAYVGGKGLDNGGGRVVDFLLENRLTHNVALLEIKTPATKVLGTKYREGVHNVSSDLSGSVLQVLDYKASLLSDWNTLRANGDALNLDPQCVVIIGSTGQLQDEKMRKSLELFRAGLSGVVVLCFDELFEKTESLVRLLEQVNS
jgi:hypothetical protein